MPRDLGPWKFAGEGVVTQRPTRSCKRTTHSSEAIGTAEEWNSSSPVSVHNEREKLRTHRKIACPARDGFLSTTGRNLRGRNRGQPIQVNRYIIAHGEARSLVLYWYQSRDRAVADEFKAKFWVMADALRYNRTDTALVRVIVPIRDRDDVTAEKQATAFVQSMYGTLLDYLPQADPSKFQRRGFTPLLQ